MQNYLLKSDKNGTDQNPKTFGMQFSCIVIIVVDFASKYSLLDKIENGRSAANFAVLIITILSMMKFFPYLRISIIHTILVFELLLNISFSDGETTKYSLIYLSFIISSILFYSTIVENGISWFRFAAYMAIFFVASQTTFLYLISGFPSLNDYLGGWLYQGFQFGITKAMLNVFFTIGILYLVASGKWIYVIAMSVYCYPLLLSTRTGTVVLIICILTHLIARTKGMGELAFALGWALLLSLIGYALYTGAFDRLPSYAIAVEILSQNAFGLGHRTYASFVLENLDLLNAQYRDIFSQGVVSVFIGAESMYADFIATHGFAGILIAILYNLILLLGLSKYSSLSATARWIVLVWGAFMYGGIAQDYTHLNVLFYAFFAGVLAVCSFKPPTAASAANA